MLALRSGWLVMPVSMTATTTPVPVALSQAGRTLIEALEVPKPHCSLRRASLGVSVARMIWSTSTYSTFGSAASLRISSSDSAWSSARSERTTLGPVARRRTCCRPRARPCALGRPAAAVFSDEASAVVLASSWLPSLYLTMNCWCTGADFNPLSWTSPAKAGAASSREVTTEALRTTHDLRRRGCETWDIGISLSSGVNAGIGRSTGPSARWRCARMARSPVSQRIPLRPAVLLTLMT